MILTVSIFQDVFYLNPWEFLMLWKVKVLPKPTRARAKLSSTPPELTKWNDSEHEDESKGFSVNPAADEYCWEKGGDILFYPDPEESGGSKELRNTFYMQRRRRPMVPAPASCPMPDKQRSGERRDRLYLLYLQPWVLEASWALPEVVPHICFLNKVEDRTCAESICLYSYSQA